MGSREGKIDQSECASAGSYFVDVGQREGFVFPGVDFGMVTDEIKAANVPFGGLVIPVPDVSVS